MQHNITWRINARNMSAYLCLLKWCCL